ncbi:thymidylate kinase [Clostridia bacterium]|nr:thymidylate kinase [Clostridia bacterium]
MFITFEGCDGAGKTTQVNLLREFFLRALPAKEVVIFREPGGTAVGERVRDIIIDKNLASMSPISELFLYAAARAQIVSEKIRPALALGKIVICDRFTHSTIAYQHFGRGIPREIIDDINAYATGGLSPEITFFLDIPPKEALRRLAARNGEPDRMELENAAFHQKVYNGYKELAKKDDKILTIDALRDCDKVFEDIINRKLG